MRLMRVGERGREMPALWVDAHTVLDLSELTPDIDGDFLASGGVERVRQAADAGELPTLRLGGSMRVGAPIARPQAVPCIGMNYAAHARETGLELPTYPVLFYKAPNTVVGPDDDIVKPRGSTRLDYEVELGVVIGRRARYLASVEEARECIAGYVLSHDVSERAFQFDVSGGQWSKGKNAETFNPLGPWLVTPDEVPSIATAPIRTWVNGELRQDSTTADLVFDVPTLIHHLSQYTVLEPGDLVNTGTPQGVAMSGRFPYLEVGDVVELEIEGLGRQRQTVVAAQVG
jgi:2-keto-4-pentenoate hydratase/2-oxohepta-3-ene-1,7-dioic acid hydratase in catechol pathway